MTGRTPEGYEIAHCRSCQGPIVWATSFYGTPMPVDAEPVDDGNVELRLQPGLFVGPVALVLPRGNRPLGPGPLRKTHFTTCPNAGSWRRR